MSKSNHQKSKVSWTVLSLGGSIIVPDEIDVSFLKKFRELVTSLRSHRFVIACGGGATSKRYMDAARRLGKPAHDELDWIGIKSLRLNAALVRSSFGKKAYGEVPDHPSELKRLPREQVIVAAADAPGRSSDYDAVLWAKHVGATQVINLSNIDFAYTGDPRTDKMAVPIDRMTWKEYLAIVGTKWSPRLSTPFDPIAAKLANRLGIEALILNGRKLANVKKAIQGKAFKGSVLHP